MYVLRTDDNKKVVINRKTDECLYLAPRNPPNTGLSYTSGVDLYMHIAKSGKRYFYLYHWSMWQGTEPYYELITEDEAKEFLLKKAGLSGWSALTESEIKRANELFPSIFDEDA